jgi:glycosyltransferase involved in cell wall biosynthesis
MENKLQVDYPILTIGIPTYNRPEEIKKQVRLLLPQLDKRVHLIIYDNCSDIPTESYFTNDELSKFTLVRNKVNVGADANIARCFENCNTKWLWTLSDDDYVKKNSVNFVLEIINKKVDTVFLNFCKGVSFETKGFDELIQEFKSSIVFSSSFTMSSCLYNINKLQSSLQNYYNNLSSMMGTIILVLKYLQINKEGVCEFIDGSLIDSYNTEVGWDYRVYLKRSRLFLDAFNKKNNIQFHKTLYLGYHITNYLLILYDRNKIRVSYAERWGLFLLVVKNQGIINAVLYCPKMLIRVFVHLIFQHKYLKTTLRLIKGF